MKVDRDILVTVLMPAFNAEQYLDSAIKSIVDQTFKDFEFLIVDDGSTDSTLRILKNYKDDRIRLVKNKRHLGLADTLNKGIELARGEYIARMDSDDISLKKRLEVQVNYLKKHSDVDIVGSWVYAFDDSQKTLWRYPESDKEIRCELFFRSALAHPSVVYRKRLFAQKLHYVRDYKYAEDFELWKCASLVTKIRNIKRPLLHYRLNPDSQARKNRQKQSISLKKIHRVWFRKIGLVANKNEIELHTRIGLYNYPDDKDFIERAFVWFKKIQEFNNQEGYYPKDLFNKKCKDEYEKVLRNLEK